MKIFRNVTIALGIIWLLCFLTLLISKNKQLDETMMALSILSLYIFTIAGVSFLVTKLIVMLKNRKSK